MLARNGHALAEEVYCPRLLLNVDVLQRGTVRPRTGTLKRTVLEHPKLDFHRCRQRVAEHIKTALTQAGREKKILFQNRIPERTLASPAISHGQIFLRTDDHLIAIGAPAAKGAAGQNPKK